MTAMIIGDNGAGTSVGTTAIDCFEVKAMSVVLAGRVEVGVEVAEVNGELKFEDRAVTVVAGVLFVVIVVVAAVVLVVPI